jgi:hypothetical protein
LKGAYFLSIVTVLLIVNAVCEQVTFAETRVGHVNVDKPHLVVVAFHNTLNKLAAQVLVLVVVRNLGVLVCGGVRLVVLVTAGTG